MVDKTGLNDPIHGYMEFDPLLVQIMHTPSFQRMKNIKQLGVSYWIFPGASHNRFEHSLGTAHLAGMMIERLRDVGDGRDYVTDEDVLCVKIAALCHDLGHGPFSHVFDTTMRRKLIEYHECQIEELSNQESTDAVVEKLAYHRKQIKGLDDWEHEDASCDMFDYMIEQNPELKKAFEEKDPDESKRKLIKEIIKGKSPDDGPLPEELTINGKAKWFLFEIVANKVNEIDCDKFDYFARDCHNLGMKSNFDHLRYIHNIHILQKPGTNELHLSVRKKLKFNLYELFHTRWSLHHRAYQHKTSRAIEEMITDAFVLLEQKYKFSEAIRDMKEYAKLTDGIFYEILNSSDTDEKTKEAQAILKRVQERDLYEFYGEFQPDQKLEINDLKAAEEIAKLSGGQVYPDDFFVRTVNIHFGQKEKDPVESVLFHKKNLKVIDPIHRSDVSRMLPEKFSEQYVRVYGKNRNDKKKIIVDSFKKWSKDKKIVRDNQWANVVILTVSAVAGAGVLSKYLFR